MKKVNTMPVRMADRDLAMLDLLCAMAPDKPSRSEMTRRLIARAIQQDSKP
jgi:hypothetical protein